MTSIASEDKKSLLITYIITLLCLVAPFASDSYSPSLPAITKALGGTANVMQLTVSLYLLGAAFAQLLYGPLSDRFGRRKIILVGLTICSAGSLLCAFAFSPLFLLMARFVQGAGAGATNALFRAVMRDTFAGERLAKVLSYVSIVFPIAAALAPVLGGYIEAFAGWRANFAFTTGFVAIIGTIIWRFLPETNLHINPYAIHPKQLIRNYFTLLTHRQFLCACLLSSLAFSGFMCYYAAAPFLLENVVGLSAVQFGWLSVFIAGGTMLGAIINGRLVVRRDINQMLFFGISVMLSSGLAMLSFGLIHILNTFVVVIPVFFFSIASGLVFSNAMVKAFQAFAHMAGIAGAMYGFLQMFCSMVISMQLAKWHTHSQLPLAVTYTLIGITALFLFTQLLKKETGINS